MDLGTVLAFASGILAGVVAALVIIAPKTKTTKDDKALEYAKKAQDVVDLLKGATGSSAAKKAEPKV